MTKTINELSPREFIALQLVTTELAKDNLMTDVEYSNMINVLNHKARNAINQLEQAWEAERLHDERMEEQQAEYERIEKENQRMMAAFTPEKVNKLQADFAERKTKANGGFIQDGNDFAEYADHLLFGESQKPTEQKRSLVDVVLGRNKSK